MATPAARLAAFVREHDAFIITVLTVYAEHMTEAADSAGAQYRQGQADPAQLAAQNASLITNNGYKHGAAQFADAARHASAPGWSPSPAAGHPARLRRRSGTPPRRQGDPPIVPAGASARPILRRLLTRAPGRGHGRRRP